MTFQLFINDVLWLETRDIDHAFYAFREAMATRRDWPKGGNVRLRFIADKVAA